MKLFRKNIRRYNTRILTNVLLARIGKRLSDATFIKVKWSINMDYPLNLKNPRTFNEKLQWLKLYDRKEIYTTMVDKYAVKKFISDIIGKEYIIPTLGAWNTPLDIEWDKLPNQFVLKCSHDSGGIVICKNKAELNKKDAEDLLNKSLKSDFFSIGREWPYKNVKRKVIAEQYLVDESGTELKDYKFFCFNGNVRCFKIDIDRFTRHKANYYDENGDFLDFGELAFERDKNANVKIPENLSDMILLAEKLSKGFPFLRVDFYNISGKIYFGELTFFPASGMGKLDPSNWDIKLGDWLILPQRKTI